MTYGPAGNSSNKFGSKNPISRYLMRGFVESLHKFIARTQVQSVLEIGCGEGEIQKLIASYGFKARFAFDIDLPIVHDARSSVQDTAFFVANGENIPAADKTVDLSLAIEMLEHVPFPDKVLHEISRVTRQYVIASVPREPIWRVLNAARGAYLRDWGNTPGHIQHWSSTGFVSLMDRHFEVIDVSKPLPWTMVLAAIKT